MIDGNFFRTAPGKKSSRWIVWCLRPSSTTDSANHREGAKLGARDRRDDASIVQGNRSLRTLVDTQYLNIARHDSLWYGNFGSTAASDITTGAPGTPSLDERGISDFAESNQSTCLHETSSSVAPEAATESTGLPNGQVIPYTRVRFHDDQDEDIAVHMPSSQRMPFTRYYGKVGNEDGESHDSWFGFDVPSDSDDWDELETERSLLRYLQECCPTSARPSGARKMQKLSIEIKTYGLRSTARSLSNLGSSTTNATSAQNRTPFRTKSSQSRFVHGISSFARNISTLSSRE
jgi:hypothetical protein